MNCTNSRWLRMSWRLLLLLSCGHWQLEKWLKLMKKIWAWPMLSSACSASFVKLSVLALFLCLTACTTNRSMLMLTNLQQKSRDSSPSTASIAISAQSCLHPSTSTLKVATITDMTCVLSSTRLTGPINTRSSTKESRRSRARRKI